jgi:hypothetical protein
METFSERDKKWRRNGPGKTEMPGGRELLAYPAPLL